MATGPRSSPRLASWREPSITLRNYLEGFVTLSALVALNAAGRRPVLFRALRALRAQVSASIAILDRAYFGNATNPRNIFDAKAGLDVSPAISHHLGMVDNEFTAWRFVDAADVPRGPWTDIVTSSGNNRS